MKPYAIAAASTARRQRAHKLAEAPDAEEGDRAPELRPEIIRCSDRVAVGESAHCARATDRRVCGLAESGRQSSGGTKNTSPGIARPHRHDPRPE
eukprot:2650962-Prymnesium_polylepis.4